MIYDRTQADVDAAKNIFETKVKNFIGLTAEEIAQLQRGTFEKTTIDRIEEKQKDLKGVLNGLGYYNIDIKNKSWTGNEIFDSADFNRLINNSEALKKGFFSYPATPEKPPATYTYSTINAIEKILFDIDVMINEVKSYYRECGTFNCGEE